jgi:hypothetical protein
MEKYYEAEYKAKKHKCDIDIGVGFRHIEPALYNKVLREMGNKQVSAAKNIHDEIDILSLTDAVSENGKIKSYKVSTGLHVHFSLARNCRTDSGEGTICACFRYR